MDDKYNTFDNIRFKYHYPYTWKKRNKKYLQLREDRKKHNGKKYVKLAKTVRYEI